MSWKWATLKAAPGPGGAAAIGTMQSRTRALSADLEGRESVCWEMGWWPSSFDVQGWTGDLEASVRVCHKESPRLHEVVCFLGPPTPQSPVTTSRVGGEHPIWWELVRLGLRTEPVPQCALQ